jgi:ELWxxDGT repeat protein
MVASNVYYSRQVAIAGNNAFFVAGDYNTGYELWKSDGTVGGTRMVKDIYPGVAGSYPYSLVPFGNKIYFAAYDGGYSYSFWKSDGTERGTIKLKDLTPAYADDLYGISLLFRASGDNLYFNAVDYTANPYIGAELYKTNGTVAGTKLVMDINPYSDAYPNNLTDVNGILFFTANDGTNGNELWKTNGTATGTKLVRDISPGAEWSNLNNLCSAGNKLFFLKDQYQSNQSFWSSDGTNANTSPVEDAGLNGLSLLHNLTASGNKLFFQAYSYKYGTELYEGEINMNNETEDRRQSPVTKTIIKAMAERFDGMVYPNPTQGSAVLHISGYPKEVLVSIRDVTGKLLWQSKYSNPLQVDLPTEKLTAGIYVISITNGLESKVIKLIKQ